MYNNINIINANSFQKEIEEMNCGAKPFALLSSKDFEIPSQKTYPIEGYIEPENFPNCCNHHKGIYTRIHAWFEKFPNCCNSHRKLLNTTWFNKKNYEGIELKVLNQLNYTEHHIIKQIDLSDWYKDITDYIDYNIFSFGQLPDGYGGSIGLQWYLGNLKIWLEWLKSAKNNKIHISKIKCQRLIEYLNEGHSSKDSHKTDINILYSTYQKWLKTFPFGLYCFREFKKEFINKLPIFEGELEFNKYVGQSRGKIITQSRLIESLIKTTNHLLQLVDSTQLYNDGLISDLNKHKIDIINNNHRMKQLSLVGEFDRSEIKYVTILKNWLSNEKEYFNELTQALNKQDLKQNIDLQNTKPDEKLEFEPTRSKQLKENLIRYKFYNYLEVERRLTKNQINKIEESILKNEVPFIIALLNEVDFIDYFKKEFCNNIGADRDKLLGSILNVNARRIKGNINVLTPKSKEDKSKYTAHHHKAKVKILIKGL